MIKNGDRFGKLIVLYKTGKTKDRHAVYRCKCDCGSELDVISTNLKSGNTRSCGCIKIEQLRRRSTKHGLHTVPLYTRWKGMRQRCNNPKNNSYDVYGGRGISVCKEWDSFSAFYEWAMSHGYSPDLELDRIDTNGNYCPENCRFVTSLENNHNRRCYIEANSENNV